jgi:hypothetical protein
MLGISGVTFEVNRTINKRVKNKNADANFCFLIFYIVSVQWLAINHEFGSLCGGKPIYIICIEKYMCKEFP